MATSTHGHAARVECFEHRFENCSLFDAVISAASQVEGLAEFRDDHPRYIRVARWTAGSVCWQFVTKVWNADAWNLHEAHQARIGKLPPRAFEVGHYAIETRVSRDVEPVISLCVELEA